MGDIGINTRYLSSNRGIIKVLQIVLGFIICSLLYGGCFGEGRIGYCSGLNFVILIINIVLFIINFLNIISWRLERIYSVIASVLFLVGSVLIVWYLIEYRAHNNTSLIISAVHLHYFSVLTLLVGCKNLAR
uniref:MARVEL domain-containing protein n=1 Tax=Syphacia muris TaxID=451379 RepID=A0A0N5A9Q7_9BILA